MPAILEAAASGPQKLRLTAVGVLDRHGQRLQRAGAAECRPPIAMPNWRQAALSALARLPGNEVDADFLARLPAATGKNRQVLITLAGQRHIDRALPSRRPQRRRPGCRSAQRRRANHRHPRHRRPSRRSRPAAAGDPKRQGARGHRDGPPRDQWPHRRARPCRTSLPLARNDDSALRIIALHVLASAGGPEALGAVKSAVQDKDETVQDEAVRTLSTWPNNWPEDSGVAEPLLTLARSGSQDLPPGAGACAATCNTSRRDKQLKDDEKVGKVNDVLPLIKRPEEKRLAIAAIGNIPNARRAGDARRPLPRTPPSPRTPAPPSSSWPTSPMPAVSQDQRQAALQVAVEKATSDDTKKQAGKLLKESQIASPHIGRASVTRALSFTGNQGSRGRPPSRAGSFRRAAPPRPIPPANATLPHSGQRVTGNCAPQCGHVACVSNVSNGCEHLSHRHSGPMIGACWQDGQANPLRRGIFATRASTRACISPLPAVQQDEHAQDAEPDTLRLDARARSCAATPMKPITVVTMRLRARPSTNQSSDCRI